MSVEIRNYNHNTKITSFVKEAVNNLYNKTKNKSYLNISVYKQPNVNNENRCVLIYNSLSGKTPRKIDKLFNKIRQEIPLSLSISV